MFKAYIASQNIMLYITVESSQSNNTQYPLYMILLLECTKESFTSQLFYIVKIDKKML